jgi:hypothetical protein
VSRHSALATLRALSRKSGPTGRRTCRGGGVGGWVSGWLGVGVGGWVGGCLWVITGLTEMLG